MASVVATLLCASSGAALELGLRTEARGRTALQTDVASGMARDVEIDPRVVLSLSDGPLSGSVSYAPRLLFSDVGTDAPRAAPLHRFELLGSLNGDRTLRFFGGERFSIGRQDFSPLSMSASSAPPDRLAALRPLSIIESVTTAGAEVRFSKRLRAVAKAGWTVFGGLDAEARDLLPLRQGPRGSIEIGYALDRLDEAAAFAQAEHAIFSNGRAVTVMESGGALWRRFDRELRGEIAAGVAGVRAYGGDSPELTLSARPVLALSLERALPIRGERFTAGVRGRLGPAIDPVSGDAYERIEGMLSIDWQAWRQIGFGARAGATRPLEGIYQGQLVSTGDLEARWTMSPHVALSAGARAIFGDVLGTQWTGFVAATFADREGL